jgi:hypothetical protein
MKWPAESVVVEIFIPVTLTVMFAEPRADAAAWVDVAVTPDPALTVPSIVAVPEGAMGLSPPQETRARPVRATRPRTEKIRTFVIRSPEERYDSCAIPQP